MFWLLMRTRLLAGRNTVLYSWRQRPFVTLLLIEIGIGLFGGMFVGFLFFFRFAFQLHVLSETVYQVFFYLFLLLLAGAVPFVASTLLQSEDYNLLFASPVSPRTVVAAKLLDATITNSLQFSVLGIPAMVACAAAANIPLFAWLLVPLLIALFVLMPALLTAAALLLALACVGMQRLRAGITLINILMGVIVCITFVVEVRNSPLKLANAAHLSALQPVLDAKSPSAHIFPSRWFAEILVQLSRNGPDARAILPLFYAFMTDALLFIFCMSLGGKLLTMSNLSMGEGSGRVGGGRINQRSFLSTLIPAPIAGMIAKDFKFLWRDSMLVSQLSVPLILFVVPFLLEMQNHGMDPRTELYPLAIVITGIIVYMQTSILSLSLLGMESRSFWVALASPNSRRTILLSKWAMSTLVSGGIGVFLGLFDGIIFRATPLALVIQTALTLCASAALCALGVGISAIFPRFVHENPAMRVSPWALIFGFFTATGYLILSGLILGLGAYLSASDQIGTSAQTVWSVCIALFVLLTFTAIVAPLALGARRIEGYEWQH